MKYFRLSALILWPPQDTSDPNKLYSEHILMLRCRVADRPPKSFHFVDKKHQFLKSLQSPYRLLCKPVGLKCYKQQYCFTWFFVEQGAKKIYPQFIRSIGVYFTDQNKTPQKYLKTVPFLDLHNCNAYRFWYRFVKLVNLMSRNLERRITQNLQVVNDLQS